MQFVIMQLVIVTLSLLKQKIPPLSLSLIVQLVIVALLSEQYNPAPNESVVLLPIVQLVIIGLLFWQQIPPPKYLTAELPHTVQLIIFELLYLQ